MSPSPPRSTRESLSLALLALGALACLIFPLSAAVALILGIVIALLIRENPLAAKTSKLSQWLLKASVVGLGAGMNLGVIWKVGVHDIGYTVVSITATLALGFLLGRWLRLKRDITLLIATGTAICGGSAIAAVAGVIKPSRHDITIALTVVFLLNGLALLIFPPLGHQFGFTQHQFGLWAALAIHDTSSVVGAGLAYGQEALRVATTVKLTRALWIVPVALVVGLYWPQSDPSAAKPRRRLPVPGFILGFIAMAAVFTYISSLAPLRDPITHIAERLFAITLFLIGAGFSTQALRKVGLRPVILGTVLWLCVASLTALALHENWIS